MAKTSNSQDFHLNRPESRQYAMELISKLPINDAGITGDTWVISIFKLEESRRDAQNRLMWFWNKSVAETRQDVSTDWVHGFSKRRILQPLYLGWGGAAYRRGQFVQDVLDRIPRDEVKNAVAYDMVRTRKLTVKRFAEYLTSFEQFWTPQGVLLRTSDDLYYEAMGIEADSRG